jgi:hypothetical protein
MAFRFARNRTPPPVRGSRGCESELPTGQDCFSSVRSGHVVNGAADLLAQGASTAGSRVPVRRFAVLALDTDAN